MREAKRKTLDWHAGSNGLLFNPFEAEEGHLFAEGCIH